MKSPVMYLIANKGLGMSPGKLAAQVAHGAVRAFRFSDTISPSTADYWLENGETKIVLEARDAEHLMLAREYIQKRGFRTFLVIDEGRTEVPALSATVLAVELVDKTDENVKSTFETFKTYKETPTTFNVVGPLEMDSLGAGPRTKWTNRFTRSR
jgi:PTH2 family peptidyl-tRNA hydrolase